MANLGLVGCEGRGSQSQGALENSKTTGPQATATPSELFPLARTVLAGEPNGASRQRPGF